MVAGPAPKQPKHHIHQQPLPTAMMPICLTHCLASPSGVTTIFQPRAPAAPASSNDVHLLNSLPCFPQVVSRPARRQPAPPAAPASSCPCTPRQTFPTLATQQPAGARTARLLQRKGMWPRLRGRCSASPAHIPMSNLPSNALMRPDRCFISSCSF